MAVKHTETTLRDPERDEFDLCCPCRVGHGEFDRKRLCVDIGCACYWSTEKDVVPNSKKPCQWPGHAAHRRALAKVRLAQAEKIGEFACAISWYELQVFNEARLYRALGKEDARTVLGWWRRIVALKEDRDRLRREFEEASK